MAPKRVSARRRGTILTPLNARHSITPLNSFNGLSPIFGTGKRKTKTTLTFADPSKDGSNGDERTAPPPKKVARKSKRPSKKKRRKIAKKSGRATKQREQPDPVEVGQIQLDSVFLQWKKKIDERFAGVRDMVIIKALKLEVKRFEKLAKKPLSDRFTSQL